MMILTEKLSFAFGKKINLMRTRSLLLQRKIRWKRPGMAHFVKIGKAHSRGCESVFTCVF